MTLTEIKIRRPFNYEKIEGPYVAFVKIGDEANGTQLMLSEAAASRLLACVTEELCAASDAALATMKAELRMAANALALPAPKP